MRKTILVVGGTGQIGIELSRLAWPAEFQVYLPARDELDISDVKSVDTYFASTSPICVINVAAYTAVDKAEEETGVAFLVNSQGPALLAQAARRAGAAILHVSTDYVFNGSSDTSYRENDRTDPLSAYGASKLAGELAVRASNARHIILRTAWVLSAHRTNFLKTMLRLASSTAELKVVADQIGSPTSAADIAVTLQVIALKAIKNADEQWGVYNFVNSGQASWYELAEYIFDWQAAHGFSRPKVIPIPSSEYPTAAHRPANSRLDTTLITRRFGIRPRHWRAAVDEIMSEITAAHRNESAHQ